MKDCWSSILKLKKPFLYFIVILVSSSDARGGNVDGVTMLFVIKFWKEKCISSDQGMKSVFGQNYKWENVIQFYHYYWLALCLYGLL